MKSLIPALFAGGLLLAGQACFAGDQWAGPMGAEFGPKAKAELAALGEKGRTAFRNALLACGLHVDDPSTHKEDCKVALKVFVVEFSNEHSLISLFFNDAITSAEVWEANIQLSIQQGRHELPGDNLGKADIADLQKIYRETATTAPKTVQPSAVSSSRTTVLQPSFDCSKATTRIESIICSDPELAEWDASLGRAYKREYARLAGNDRQGLIKDQRQWISSRNAQCNQPDLAETKTCIIQFTKSRLTALAEQNGQPLQLGDQTASNNAESIPLSVRGGTFVVPVIINDQITLNFTIDSGAADVSIPADVVSTLIRTGTIQKSDFVGQKTYRLADGSTVPSATFLIRSLKVGNRLLENVTGSVASTEADLLLGQSFLRRFKSWSIDNARQVLVLTQ